MSLLLASLVLALAPVPQDPTTQEGGAVVEPLPQDEVVVEPPPQGVEVEDPLPQGDGPVDPAAAGEELALDPGAGARESLARLAVELEEALASRYPAAAAGFGIDSTRQPLADDSAWWIRFLEHHTNSLESLWTAGLDERERSLRDALVDRCRVETILITALPRRRWDPMFHLELATDELARARDSAGEERERRFRLAASILEQTRTQVVTLRNGWVEEALLRVAGLRQELSALAAEPGAAAVLAACQGFEDWLRDSDKRRGEAIPRVGRHNFEALLNACSGSRHTIGELRMRLLREVARLDNAIGSAQAPPTTAASVERALALAAACVAFVRERVSAAELLPPPGIELELVQRPGSLVPDGDPLVRHEPGRSRIVVTVPHPLWPAPLAQSYAREQTPLALGAWSMRWGIPGEGHLVGIARGLGDARPLSWSRAALEGWGLYALDWLLRHPSTAPVLRSEQPELCREMLRVRRYETALCLAALEWHAFELPENRIAEDLARRAGIDVARARIEVRRATHDPLLGIGALGALEIVELEQRVVVKVPGVDPVRAVLSLLSSHPGLRPQDLLRHDLVGRRQSE